MLRDTRSLPPALGRAAPDALQPQAAAPVPGQVASCPSEPVVAAAAGKDGQFPTQADVSGLTAVDIASFVILSREAAGAGRPRDAEAALLMACRIADQLKGSGSAESADARQQLAAHYAELSLRPGAAAPQNRTELLSRAQSLYADSLLTYSARLGSEHEKSRLAANSLALMRQAQAQAAQPTQAQAPAPSVPSTGQAAQARTSTMLAAPSPPIPAAPPAIRPVPAPAAPDAVRRPAPAGRECPPAVETLGLCSPAS